MPSVSLHLLLADRVLEGWSRTPDSAPFDPGDGGAVNAFYQGALGPDLGYFPGGYRLLSELAHRVRTADLARTLVESARSSVERAFSWGWVAHFLADRAIHPLVGRAVGECVHGNRERFVDGSEEPAAHVRVETGLDTLYLEGSSLRPSGALRPVFDRETVSFLQRAYRSVYAIEVGRHLILGSHLAVTRRARQALVVTRLLGRIQGIGSHRPTMPGLRWLLQHSRNLINDRMGLESLALAYLNPLQPSPWLVEAVDREVEGFRSLYMGAYEEGLDGLDNCDLDSGLSDIPGCPSEIASGILARLRRPTPGVRPVVGLAAVPQHGSA